MFQFLSGKSKLSKSSKSSVVNRSRSTARRKHLASGLLRCTGGERSRSCTPERNARISCRLPTEYTQLSSEEFLKSFSASTEKLSSNGINGKCKSVSGNRSNKKKLSKSEKQKLAAEREQQKKKLMLLQHQEQMLLQLQQQNKQEMSSGSNCSSLKENNPNGDNEIWKAQHVNSYETLADRNISDSVNNDISNLSGDICQFNGKVPCRTCSNNESNNVVNINNSCVINNKHDNITNDVEYRCNNNNNMPDITLTPVKQQCLGQNIHTYENLKSSVHQTPNKQVINSDNYIIRLNPNNQTNSNSNTPNKTCDDCFVSINTNIADNIACQNGISRCGFDRQNDVTSHTYAIHEAKFANINEYCKSPQRPKTLSATKTTFGIVSENEFPTNCYNNFCNSQNMSENTDLKLNNFENFNNIPHYANNINNNINDHHQQSCKHQVLKYRSQPSTPDEQNSSYLNNLFATPQGNPHANHFNGEYNHFLPNYPCNYITDLTKQLSLQEQHIASDNLELENVRNIESFGGFAENHFNNNFHYIMNNNNFMNHNNYRSVRTRLFNRFDDYHHRRSPGMGCRSAMMRKLAQCHCQPVIYNPSSNYYQLNNSLLNLQHSEKCEILINGNKLSHEMMANHCSPTSVSTRTSSVERKLINDSGVCSISDDEKITFISTQNSSHINICNHFNNNSTNSSSNNNVTYTYNILGSNNSHNNRPNSQLYDVSPIEMSNYFIGCPKAGNDDEVHCENEYARKMCNTNHCNNANHCNNIILQKQHHNNFQRQFHEYNKQRLRIETVKRSRSTPCDSAISSSSSSSSSRLPLIKNFQLNHIIYSRITDMVVVSRNNFIVAVDMHSAFLFDNNGEFQGKLGGRHHRKHSLVQPLSVATCGDYFVAFNDRGQQNIKVFNLDDQLMFVVDDPLFTNIAGLSCNVDGDIFIAATDAKCVFVFRLQSPNHLHQLPSSATSKITTCCLPAPFQPQQNLPQVSKGMYRHHWNGENECSGIADIDENLGNNNNNINNKVGLDKLNFDNDENSNMDKYCNKNYAVEHDNNHHDRTNVNIKKINKPTFEHPYCIAVNPTNQQVIVGDDERHVVIAMDNQTGQSMWRFIPHEARDGNFLPACLCCDWRGNVFVGDSCNNKIYLLNSSGKFLKTILTVSNGLKGSPSAICTDSVGRLYVTDEQSTIRVFKYLDEGSL